MGFDLKNTSGKGRPKGVQNKNTLILRKLTAAVTEEQINAFFKDLSEIDDPIARASLRLKFLEFCLPKRVPMPGAIGDDEKNELMVSGRYSHLSEEELKELVKKDLEAEK